MLSAINYVRYHVFMRPMSVCLIFWFYVFTFITEFVYCILGSSMFLLYFNEHVSIDFISLVMVVCMFFFVNCISFPPSISPRKHA